MRLIASVGYYGPENIIYPQPYLTGTEYFRATWNEVVVDVVSNGIYCQNIWVFNHVTEKLVPDKNDHHNGIALQCMNYLLQWHSVKTLGPLTPFPNLAVLTEALFIESLNICLFTQDAETLAYVKKYWAMHVAYSLSSPSQDMSFYKTLETLATKWILLNLDPADAHHVVQGLKVS